MDQPSDRPQSPLRRALLLGAVGSALVSKLPFAAAAEGAKDAAVITPKTFSALAALVNAGTGTTSAYNFLYVRDLKSYKQGELRRFDRLQGLSHFLRQQELYAKAMQFSMVPAKPETASKISIHYAERLAALVHLYCYDEKTLALQNHPEWSRCIDSDMSRLEHTGHHIRDIEYLCAQSRGALTHRDIADDIAGQLLEMTDLCRRFDDKAPDSYGDNCLTTLDYIVQRVQYCAVMGLKPMTDEAKCAIAALTDRQKAGLFLEWLDFTCRSGGGVCEPLCYHDRPDWFAIPKVIFDQMDPRMQNRPTIAQGMKDRDPHFSMASYERRKAALLQTIDQAFAARDVAKQSHDMPTVDVPPPQAYTHVPSAVSSAALPPLPRVQGGAAIQTLWRALSDVPAVSPATPQSVPALAYQPPEIFLGNPALQPGAAAEEAVLIRSKPDFPPKTSP